MGAAALCLDARRAARWAAPLLGGLVAAFLAAVALTPRISGSYPPVDALAALLAPGLGLLAGRLRLRRGGAILLGAAALGAMALCAALGSRAGALLSAAALAGAALELGRRGAWRAGRGAAWAVAAACAAALLARTAAYALANLGWTATEPNLPVLLRTDLGCAADRAAACAGLAADARLRPLRRAGKGGMLFPCAGLRRAGRRERA